jgi:hypothetical protein
VVPPASTEQRVEPPSIPPHSPTPAENSREKTPAVDSAASDDTSAEIDRIRAFLDQAAGIVAVERGLNAKSRLKLASIARELGLSDAELEGAMHTLQRGEQEPTLTAEELAQLRRSQRKFHNFVGETLMALPQGVLTASMEQMLVAAGVDEYRLKHELAQQEILDLVQKLRVRRITAAEAERHIVGLADLAIAPDGVLPSDVRQRIVYEASRWGLTPDQVDPILDERVRQARLLQRSRQRRRVLLFSSVAALIVGLLGTLGIMALTYAFPSNRQPLEGAVLPAAEGNSANSAARPKDGNVTTRPMVRTLPAPSWWSDDLELSMALAGARIPSYRENLNELRVDDEERRSTGYGQLLADIRREILTRDQHAMLVDVLASSYALDPSETCAAKIRDELLTTASGPDEQLSESMQPWEVSLWAGDAISAALVHPQISQERSAALASAFERTFAERLDSDSPARLSAQVQSAVAARLYGTLSAGAKARPELAIDLHARLLPLIDAQLDAAARDRLQTDYLTAVLPTLGERWVIYEDLIRRSVYSEDPLNVLKMLELCERTTEAGLRGYLATQLALRTGLRGTPRTMPELVAAVRGALGATETVRPIDTKQRLAQWREGASNVLEKKTPPSASTRDLLQLTIELARLSALGAALAEGELGATEFDARWREAVPTLKVSGTASRTIASPRLNTTQLKNLERSTTALRGYSRLSKLYRMNHVRAVKTFESALSDVLPDQGQDIAAYLTAAKAVDEHEQVMTLVDGILRWRMVRLAIADQLADSRLREEHLLQLVSSALRRDFKADDDHWREQARIALLADVARELEAESSLSVDGDGIENQASRTLAGYYLAQAKLAGAPSSDLGTPAMPGESLLLLVKAMQAKLSAQSSPESRAIVERLPHELTVVEYLAADDLTRTVLLQRHLVELVAAAAKSERAGSATQVSLVRTEFQDRSKRASSALEQLAAGERAILQLWMIRNG